MLAPEARGAHSAHDAPVAPVASSEQILTFFVREQEFGVEILRVHELQSLTAPMPVPQSPAWLKGVINLRGEIIPIADLRERLGFEPIEYGPLTVVVVLRVVTSDRQRTLGIIVDAMSDVVNVEGVQPAPQLTGNGEKPWARGIARTEKGLITLLDIDSLFSSLGAVAR
jgi:purine-binding chemotaxis protein CheW